MKFMNAIIFSLAINTCVLAETKCENVTFQYSKGIDKISKIFFMCPLRTDRGLSYVSKNCLNDQCPELKNKKTMVLKKLNFAVNSSRSICERLSGVYLDGLLTVAGKNDNRPFCFFQSGSIISSDYLYAKKKDLIKME